MSDAHYERASAHFRAKEVGATALDRHYDLLPCLVRPKPNDVFQATHLPFDPGSTPVRCATGAEVVLRGGALEPKSHALLGKTAG
jgi:hypothetical protein